MRAITPRQLEVLQYVAQYAASYHCSPTFREVGDHFGFTSAQASVRHLEAMTKKGYLLPIIAGNGRHRGYRVSRLGKRELERAQQAWAVAA